MGGAPGKAGKGALHAADVQLGDAAGLPPPPLPPPADSKASTVLSCSPVTPPDSLRGLDAIPESPAAASMSAALGGGRGREATEATMPTGGCLCNFLCT
mmetsp:Transcript_33735/g.96777  ORF Transcript_33735/g.96777 Transcript_33735/m.96777 type:complete len:99 (-) Transcript_33735:124-420(-)